MDVTQLADRLEIIELFARYAHAYDGGTLERLADLFTKDAVFEIHGGGVGAMPAVMEGRDTIVETMTQRWRDTQPVQRRHNILNVLVEDQEADRARVCAYLLLGSIADDVLELPVTGRYTDEVRKVDGRWYFHRHVLRLDASLS